MPKGNYHPSRISNRQKLIRQKDYEKFMETNESKKLEKIDISKSNWSNRKK